MPELPEVETVRRGLAPVMEGRRIRKLVQNRADLRFPLPENFARRLTGAQILSLTRRAKFLTASLSTGETLIMHLGMTGRFTIDAEPQGRFHHEAGTHSVHDHVIFHMEGGARITYNDPRRFGFMELWPDAALTAYPRLAQMGPEPLTEGFSGAYLKAAFAIKKAPIKAALLDQSVVAGLGNIYVCEALFRAGISPLRAAHSLSRARLERLADAINAVIREAIAVGGSSISDFAAADGALGYFQHRFDVYDRADEPCKRCGSKVRRLVQSGRSTFYCAGCQR